MKDWLIALIAAIALMAMSIWCAFAVTPLIKFVLD
jgi:hypothetical protein